VILIASATANFATENFFLMTNFHLKGHVSYTKKICMAFDPEILFREKSQENFVVTSAINPDEYIIFSLD